MPGPHRLQIGWVLHRNGAGRISAVSSLVAVLAPLMLGVSCRAVAPGVAAPVGPLSTEAAASVSVVQVTFGDGTVDTASLLPGLGTPAVSQQRALTEAARYVAGSSRATGVSAHYVRLTLPGQAGADTNQPIQDRSVWLVSYAGVPFSGPQNCECAAVTAQPNTSVALDAADARLVAWFGSRL